MAETSIDKANEVGALTAGEHSCLVARGWGVLADDKAPEPRVMTRKVTLTMKVYTRSLYTASTVPAQQKSHLSKDSITVRILRPAKRLISPLT